MGKQLSVEREWDKRRQLGRHGWRCLGDSGAWMRVGRDDSVFYVGLVAGRIMRLALPAVYVNLVDGAFLDA